MTIKPPIHEHQGKQYLDMQSGQHREYWLGYFGHPASSQRGTFFHDFYLAGKAMRKRTEEYVDVPAASSKQPFLDRVKS